MRDKVHIEKCGTFMVVSNSTKNKKVCNKDADNYYL